MAKKHADNEVKRDIKQAVDALPKYVHSSEKQQHDHTPYYQEPKHATTLMWVGVASVSVFIMGLWVVNAQSLVRDAFTQPGGQESELLTNVRTDFDIITDSFSESQRNNTLNNALQPQEAARRQQEEQEISSLLKAVTERVEQIDTEEVPTSPETSQPTEDQ